MSQQIIDTGTVANDGTGTSLRAAGEMINANFTQLYTRLSIGVFAFLSAPSETDITATDTYFPINGTFSNSPAVGFGFVADPAIQYVGTETMYFEIDCNAVLFSDLNNTTVSCAIKKNGTLLTESIMQFFCKTSGDHYSLSGTCVVELKTNDKIQLVVKTDTGTDVTFVNITTTMRPFLIAIP